MVLCVEDEDVMKVSKWLDYLFSPVFLKSKPGILALAGLLMGNWVA